MAQPKQPKPTTAAEAFLMALKANGVDYLFANAGTDFAPVIEGLANQGSYSEALPEPLVIPHETAAAAMVWGRGQGLCECFVGDPCKISFLMPYS